VFSGVGEENPFSLPSGAKRLKQLKSNLDYFLVNYVLLTALIAVLFVLYRPMLIIWCAFIFGGWFYVVNVAPETVEVGGRPFSKKEMGLGMSGVTLLIIVWFMIMPLVYVVLTG
jgi:hypothetical protein